MADVKWIKIYTDMLNNKKIKRIRKMPEGNNIILIWVFLLTAAGESNKNGGLYLTNTIPFKEEDLAIEFDFEVETIRFALITLQKFDMVEIFEAVIYIKNWSEYQNIEGLDKVREQTRQRVERHRDNRKLVTQCNVTVTDDVTDSNATEIELDIEIDKEIDIETIKPSFDEFWKLYPKKLAKKDAVKAWGKLKVTNELFNLIINGVKIAIRSVNWVKDGGQFIPNAATWLNGERWNDEVEEAQTALFGGKQHKMSKADQDMEEVRRVMAEYDRENANNNTGHVPRQLS